MCGFLGVRGDSSFLGEENLDGLGEHIAARAIADARIGIGRPDRAYDRVHRALAKRELVDLTALDRDETGPHQPLQPAAFEFAGQEIADYDPEVAIIAEPSEGPRRPVREHPPIGRASCRERVSQAVYIPVEAVP